MIEPTAYGIFKFLRFGAYGVSKGSSDAFEDYRSNKLDAVERHASGLPIGFCNPASSLVATSRLRRT